VSKQFDCPNNSNYRESLALFWSVRVQLVLASSSPYRRALLERLACPFVIDVPDIDEAPLPAETPAALVVRLSQEKARAVAARHPDALIIGSDQVALFGSTILTKPGSPERAIEQLTLMRGATAHFLTGICVHNSRTNRDRAAIEQYAVTFRSLSDAAIARYVERDRPFDCAGGFRSEGLGIALFERLEGDDPTSLIGLPLIRLVTMLAAEGVDVLGRV
jgi:MAF protein